MSLVRVGISSAFSSVLACLHERHAAGPCTRQHYRGKALAQGNSKANKVWQNKSSRQEGAA